MKKSWLINFFLLIFILLIGVLAIISFFHPGFFPSHDGEWMVVRFSDFHRSLVDGQWPVRWAGRLNFGFGYPVFDFLYPGTFYITEIFHLLKLNFVDSVKATFVLSYILSGFFMFHFAKEWWGKLGGLAAAVLYLYTPYRFVDMYVRGSLGESVAFIFPPLIFLAITKLSKLSPVIASPDVNQGVAISSVWKRLLRRFTPRNDTCGWVAIGALGIAGLVTTHNVIAYLFLPLIILFILFLHLKCSSQKNVNLFTVSFTVNCLLFTVLGLGLSSFFWLPALWDKQFTIFDQVVISDFSKNFASIKELIFPSWGYGPSRPGDPTSMSFQIGIVNLFVIFLSSILLLIKARTKVGALFICLTLLAIFFMTSFSQPLWQFIPGLSLIQFPWRILSVTTFTTAFLAGFVVKEISHKKSLQTGVAVILAVMAIIFNFSYAKPKEFVNRGEGYYSTNDDTTTVQNEYLPVWVNNLAQERIANKVEIIQGQGAINNLIVKSNKTAFLYQGTSGLIKVNTVYFPGWETFLNGQKRDIIVDKQGLINLALEDGKNMVEAKFMETPIRKTSDLISLVSLFSILALFLYSMSFPRKRESI